MRTVFLINPAAGRGIGLADLRLEIDAASRTNNLDLEIYETQAVGDCERFVKETLSSSGDETITFIACGGDGTFNETLNGCIGFGNAVCSVYPNGTGNDFARNFPFLGNFRDIDTLINGSVIKCDAIKYSGIIDNVFRTRYCANMINIGFDANVVSKSNALKKNPVIPGSMSYVMSAFLEFLKRDITDLKVYMDGELVHDGPLLLTTIANGSFCGGGVKSNPYADVQDGQIDVNIVLDVNPVLFFSLFPSYKNGTHMEKKIIKKLLLNKKTPRLRVVPNKSELLICVDGEISVAKDIEIEIVHEAFNLLVPSK